MKKINILIIIVFLAISLLIGYNHEPWVDEAQSWLIARDASVYEIVWDIARYEGTFPLWHLTLKFFMSLGLTYEYLYIVPIIISLIGLIVFLTKVDAPRYVKILLPFTFYVWYQYTIVARSYCYLFLAFSLMLITYKTRLEKPLRYILSLVFLSLISMHGVVIACVFVLMLFIELMTPGTIRKNIKYFIVFGISLILEAIILCPRNDLFMTVAAVYTFPQIVKSIMESLIGFGNIYSRIFNIIGIVLFLILFAKVFFLKNKDISIVTGILFLFMFAIRFASHHSGILFFVMMFGIISHYEELKEKSKYFDKLFVTVLIIYTIFSAQSGFNDLMYSYSGAEKMAKYIQENVYQDKKIFGFGYKVVSLQPYFDKNIYQNMDEAIYRWSTSNEDFYMYTNFEDYDISYFTEVPEYIVLEWDDGDFRLGMIEDVIESTGKYEVEYRTEGYKFFKNAYCEKECYTLYKLKK